MFGPRLMLAGAVLLLAAAASIFYFSQRASAPALSVRAYVPPPRGTAFRSSGFESGPVVVSPDGKTLAFSAVDEKGVTNLWLRPLNAQQATVLAGTEDAATPFWSPDSQYLGFVTDQKLKKISVSGGEAQTIANEAASSSGAWGADDTILFHKQKLGPISRVPASGGEVSPATRLDETEISHYAPSFLPDGKHFLYISSKLNGPDEIKVGLLGKPEQVGIAIALGSRARFASDHLLFVRGGHIQVQSFDLRSFKLSGDPQTLGEASTFSVSANGVLAYHESSAESELKIFDRNGNVIGTPGPLALYEDPRFSPDGKSVAVTVQDPRSGKNDLWVYLVAGGQPTRITFGPDDSWPVWSPDGKEIAYAVFENGKFSIRRRSLDGSQPEQIFYKNEIYPIGVALDWSSNGNYLSLDLEAKDGTYSNWILPLKGGGEPFRSSPTTASSISQYDGLFSPDGHWLAYFSYESGRPEVYVVGFLSGGAKYQVSTTGGWLPRFSRSNELFFVTMGNRLMVAQIANQPNFHIESIRPVFQLDFPNFASPLWDVSADGQRFVVLTADHTKSTSITLLTNWPVELKK